jgi:AcrR family transcriptional regulator
MKKPLSTGKSRGRKYDSNMRQRQADETRSRIVDAARKLIFSLGYEGAKIDAIAREAGVATQTVYAVFGSKQKILAELLNRASFGTEYQDLKKQALDANDPHEKLRFVARIARQIHDAQHSTFDLLRGAGVFAPDLAALEHERECTRYESQKPIAVFLKQAGALKSGIQVSTARDIIWSLSSREMYRMLVRERGWSSQAYEDWLAKTLGSSVLTKNEIHLVV